MPGYLPCRFQKSLSIKTFSTPLSSSAAFPPKECPEATATAPQRLERLAFSADEHKGHHSSGFPFQCASDWPINIIFNSFSPVTLTV